MRKNLIIAAVCLIIGFFTGFFTGVICGKSTAQTEFDESLRGVLVATEITLDAYESANAENNRLESENNYLEAEVKRLDKLLFEATDLLIESAKNKPGQTNVDSTRSEQE